MTSIAEKTYDDTFALIERSQKGDMRARDAIVAQNTGLVWSVVKKFSNRGYELEDLFQIGTIGLIKCIDKFDVNFGVRFSTYAVPMIMGEIKRFLRDDGMIKVSRPLKEIATKAKYMQENLQQKTGKVPSIAEIAAALNIDVEDLTLAMDAGFEVESIYAIVHQGDGSPVYLLDKLELNSEDTSDKMIDKIALREVITALDPKERQVIVMRYFQDKTQSQIAEAIGVSQVQVSRIEKRVLKVLRQKLEA
ncbi:MAG: RNA polymerase sporulation sigma factor SigF [Defluviitaleaceae bacterium]|nr:RNA polymerase sporulation sigma factor SigF [Defluviitaleaceae bacterium]